MDSMVKTLCDMIDGSNDRIAAANQMAVIAGNLLLGTPLKEKTGLYTRAERYNKMYGLRAQMDKAQAEELKQRNGFAYPSLDIIPYSRAQSGAVAFVMAYDDDGDLAMLLLRKRGEGNHRPPQGYFKPVPPVLDISEEAKKECDTNLLDNAKRELKAEVGIDVDLHPRVRTSLLGVHGHNENPSGNDLTTNAGCFLFDYTAYRGSPTLGKGYNEVDPDPELPFDSVIWVKVKDMDFSKNEIRFPKGHITTDKLGLGVRNDMDYKFAIKAIVRTLDNELFAKTGFTAKILNAQLSGDKPKFKNGKEIIDYFAYLTNLGQRASEKLQSVVSEITMKSL